ncbi:outer membrane beta-barrel protein [Flavobacterium sp.]|uniref:outer membrane beta-barrel protein n=1 Tax=Flavobacterium sp. TaxID=239 RepID=UPI002869F466|nr:outer membrane beta-barrel protein [Flavobacterium sp.]
MRKLFLLLLTPFFVNSQDIEPSKIVNASGNWYFGVEIGSNKITSYTLGEPNKSFQGGILAEYYTGRHWSLTGRIKYFRTGLSYFLPSYKSNTTSHGMEPDFTGLFDYNEDFGKFDGAVITLPLNIKWEFRIWKNFSGNLNLGINYNFETKSKYFYSDNENYSKYNSKQYASFNAGYGFNYFISKKIGVFLNVESYSGVIKGRTKSLFFSSIYNTNSMINLGFKYNFKIE